MALTTYIELQATVADWLNKANLTTQIVDFIRIAESKMNHGLSTGEDSVSLRVDEMKKTDTVLLGTTDDSVSRTEFPIPTDFLELVEIRPTGTWTGNNGAETVTTGNKGHLERLSNHRLDDIKSVDAGSGGAPGFYSDDATGDNWNIYPSVSNYQITAYYYGEVPPLATNSTNSVLTRYPEVYLYGALSEAAKFLKLTDTTWRDQFISAMRSANRNSRIAKWSGSDLRTKNPYPWTRVI